MFRTLARLVVDPTLTTPTAVPNPEVVFAHNPIQLSRWLEEAFAVNGLASFLPAPPTLPSTTTGSQAVVDGLKMPPGLLTSLPSGISPGTVIPPGYQEPTPLGTTHAAPLGPPHLCFPAGKYRNSRDPGRSGPPLQGG